MGLIKARDTYPFGADPAWHGSRSELPFLNSLKMKMSILLGVAQMNLGIILSFFNGLFFKNSINIWSVDYLLIVADQSSFISFGNVISRLLLLII